jgi:hypothetical protein
VEVIIEARILLGGLLDEHQSAMESWSGGESRVAYVFNFDAHPNIGL